MEDWPPKNQTNLPGEASQNVFGEMTGDHRQGQAFPTTETEVFSDLTPPKGARREKEREIKKSDTFPCPQCGGSTSFNPELQALKCDYCGYTQAVDANGAVMEMPFHEANDEEVTWGRDYHAIVCRNCKAETVLNTGETSATCAFCGSTHVIDQAVVKGIKPASLIAFKFSLKQAQEAFRKWIHGKFFAPNALKNTLKLDRLKGVYIPFWTYDTRTVSNYTCQIGFDYWVTVMRPVVVNGKTEMQPVQERRTRWEPRAGQIEVPFDDLLVNASKQFYHQKMEKLEPFYLNELVPYAPQYLSGFGAERYGVSLKEGFEMVKPGIDSAIGSAILRKYGGDHIQSLRKSTDYQDLTYKHVLLPIWISSYTFKGKIYQFVINGQTGEVQGEYPRSAIKITLAVIAGLTLAYLFYTWYVTTL
jgi:ribosomal protein S27AE